MSDNDTLPRSPSRSAIWEHLKWIVGVLAIPLALAIIAHTFQSASAQKQAIDARLRLYTELLSRREEADTSVRKDMFTKVLDKFLNEKEKANDLEERIVAIELLALNFHDSLNLSPLFRQSEEMIKRKTQPERSRLLNKLDRVATLVKDRQIEVLDIVGSKRDFTVHYEDLAKEPQTIIDAEDEALTIADPSQVETSGRQKRVAIPRKFIVEVLERDAELRRLHVRVRILGTGEEMTRLHWVLWVDPYDFPLVDFIRISPTERFTIVQNRSSDESAGLVFIYFPSSRSGIKDKPFIDEVVNNLLRRDESR